MLPKSGEKDMISSRQQQEQRVPTPRARKIQASIILLAILELSGFLAFMMIVVCDYETTHIPCVKIDALWNALVHIKDIWFTSHLKPIADIVSETYGDMALVLLARLLLVLFLPCS